MRLSNRYIKVIKKYFVELFLRDLSFDNRLQISYELVKQHDMLDYKEFKKMINAA